jgi:hypothetical protein
LVRASAFGAAVAISQQHDLAIAAEVLLFPPHLGIEPTALPLIPRTFLLAVGFGIFCCVLLVVAINAESAALMFVVCRQAFDTSLVLARPRS